jgi:hypothetical protein
MPMNYGCRGGRTCGTASDKAAAAKVKSRGEPALCGRIYAFPAAAFDACSRLSMLAIHARGRR